MTSWSSGLSRTTGSDYFSNFTVNDYNEILGDEIFFYTNRLETTMSPFFFGIWKNKNKNVKF